MKIVKELVLSASQKEDILELWNQEYPEKLAHPSVAELEKYFDNLKEIQHYLLTDDDEKVHGWAASFTREEEKWFAIILSSTIQKKGFGLQMVRALQQDQTELNGWVIDSSTDKKSNGENYISPLSFYIKHGFEVMQGYRLEIPSMSAVKIKWTLAKSDFLKE